MQCSRLCGEMWHPSSYRSFYRTPNSPHLGCHRSHAWAVSQPGWQNEQEFYIKLIDYVGSEEDVKSTSWLCRQAVVSGCELDDRFLSFDWRHMERWRLPKDALKLPQLLGHRGLDVSKRFATDLLKLYPADGDREGALAALEGMKSCGVCVDVYHYVILLECPCSRPSQRY